MYNQGVSDRASCLYVMNVSKMSHKRLSNSDDESFLVCHLYVCILKVVLRDPPLFVIILDIKIN